MKIDKKMEKVLEILRKRNWTVGVMESCTGGAIANCITNIPGSSDVFEVGKITYSVKAKIEAGVDEEIIKKFGVYSIETAEEMAKKIDPPTASQSWRASVGVGVTGNLPGDVFVAVRIEDRVESIKLKVESKDKNEIKARKEMKKKVMEKVVEMIAENV